jgi:mannosyltransferase
MIVASRLRAAPAWAAPGARRPCLHGGLALTALLALAVAVALLRAHALAAPLWMDEGISVGIASHPLGAIPSVLREDGSPPLYYAILHVWMALFGATPTALHVLSLSCFALAVPAAVWAAWAPFGPAAGALAGALVALDPFTVYYADDARMYTLVLLLGLLATGAFVRAFVVRRRRHVAIFAALLAALLYTHNWAVFYTGATAIAYAGLLPVATDRRALLRDGVLAFGGAALLFAPWLPTLAYQAAHTGAPWSSVPNARELPGAVAHILSGALPAAIVLLVAISGAVERLRCDGPVQRRATLAVLGIAALTLALGFAWSHVSSPAWAMRYLVMVAAPLAVFVGAALGRFAPLGIAALVVALAFSWHGRPSDEQLMRKSNVAQVTGALGPRLAPGSLVVTTQPEQVPALRYYLGPRMRYVTPFGLVRDPQVMDWRDAPARLRDARFGVVMSSLLSSLRPGMRLLFVGPRFANANSAWSRRILTDTRVWRKALRRRLRVVASATPERRSAESTIAGLVLAVPRRTRPAAPAQRQSARTVPSTVAPTGVPFAL